MATKIAVLSQKGGTGKTTAVRTLTDVLRLAGLRVLAVDLDPQGNLSDYFDAAPDADPTIGDVLAGRASAKQAVHDDLMPANLSLAEAELTLAGKMGRELTLRKALKKVEEPYDVVMIDCPPNIHMLSWSALVAATHVVVPLQPEDFGSQGLAPVQEAIAAVQGGANPALGLAGYLLTMVDKRLGIHMTYEGMLRDLYRNAVFQAVVPRAKDFVEAVACRKPIAAYKPKGAAGKAAAAVADELMARVEAQADVRRVA